MIHINSKERVLVDGDNGDIFHPSCFDTLVLYISYIKGRNHEKDQQYTQNILRRVMDGEPVISKMIEQAQKNGVSSLELGGWVEIE